nr:MAG TPA: hypothetical protein [Caudoviricetes sp.]
MSAVVCPFRPGHGKFPVRNKLFLAAKVPILEQKALLARTGTNKFLYCPLQS